MSELVRPIRLPSQAALDVLKQRVESALASWAVDWAHAHDAESVGEVSIEPFDGRAHAPACHFAAWHGEHGRIWFCETTQGTRRLGLAVAGDSLLNDSAGVDAWVAEALSRARDTRNRAVAAALLGGRVTKLDLPSTTELPADLLAFGSGAIRVSCRQLGLDAIVDAHAWLRVAPPATRSPARRLPGPVPLERVGGASRVRLAVMLGSADIDVSTILDMRRGDVLRLSQRLDEGLAVTCAGQLVARALLGASEGRKSVQLIADHQ